MVTQMKQTKNDAVRQRIISRWKEFKAYLPTQRSKHELDDMKNAFLAGIASDPNDGISEQLAKLLIELIHTPEHEI